MPKLRRALLMVLLLLVGCGFAFYWFNPPARVNLRADSIAHPSQPNQRMQPGQPEPQAKEITYSHMEDGTRKWELAADSGDYDPTSGYIALQKVRIIFYQQNGQLYLEGDQGQYDQSGRVVVLTGNVMGRNQKGVTIKTSKLVYHDSERLVDTDEQVTVAGPTFSITSQGMKAYLNPQQVIFETKVDSFFWPHPDSESRANREALVARLGQDD